MIKDLILRNRSYRRFDEAERIEESLLLSWIDNARLSSCAANLQRLRFYYTVDAERCAEIFQVTTWAGYLPDWPGPEEGERPAAYIVIAGPSDANMMLGIDVGLASQSILLSAVTEGYGGCMIGAFNKAQTKELISFSEGLEPILIIALGKPKETVVLEEYTESIKYYRTPDGVHHVPKRSLESLVQRIS
ncbi:MAG: nitroreductase family protein [Candidatus Cloacimonetes bacterium]|nr:nitroreductase family protein [Candidatus Cloacimonadota bacterium]